MPSLSFSIKLKQTELATGQGGRGSPEGAERGMVGAPCNHRTQSPDQREGRSRNAATAAKGTIRSIQSPDQREGQCRNAATAAKGTIRSI